MASACGTAFVVLTSADPRRDVLLRLTSALTPGDSFPIQAPGSHRGFLLTTTSSGALLTLATERGIAGIQVMVAPLRLCP